MSADASRTGTHAFVRGAPRWRGSGRARRRLRVGSVALLAWVNCLIALASPVSAAASSPVASPDTSVPVWPVKATGVGRSAVDGAAIRAPRPVSWPHGGDAEMSLPGSVDGLAAGGVDAVAAGLPVRLARPHEKHSGASVPPAGSVTRVRVR